MMLMPGTKEGTGLGVIRDGDSMTSWQVLEDGLAGLVMMAR